MPALTRLVAFALMAILMAIASIAGMQNSQNPQAATGIAIIGLLIIAFCGAFAIFGIVLGVSQAIQQRLNERPFPSKQRTQRGDRLAHPRV